VFGAVYEFTENLVVPALVHGAYNATLFSLLYVAVRFGGMQPA
jgi:membrane protease YdiL (CAAX protease family)